MNQSDLHQALNKFKNNDQLKQKLKTFLGVGIIGLILVGGLIIWAGVATVQHVVNIGANSTVTEQIKNLKAEIPKIPALVRVGCWERLQSLMSIQVWLETPVAENITSLKNACLGSDIKEKPEPGAGKINGDIPVRQPER